MARTGVSIEGLAELRRDLQRAAQVDDLKELRDGLKDAADVVAQDAKRRVPSRSGAARGSVRATAGGNTAYVVGGRAKVPYYGWLDFGTRNPRSGNPRSEGPWAGSGKGPKKGRFIYAAIEDKSTEVSRRVEVAVSKALKKFDL